MSKSLRTVPLTALVLTLSAVCCLAQGGVTNSIKNAQQVAALHWYGANQTTTFSVGSFALGIAYDGANMWVPSETTNSVMKLRANDGAVLGTFTVGNYPDGVAYDGANIWVANANDATVTKLRGSDGVALGTFNTGSLPVG